MEDGNRFKKDVADPETNVKSLDAIFDIDPSTGDLINTNTGEISDVNDANTILEVKQMRKELKKIEDDLPDMPDVDQIILDNIKRANRFLDKIEDEVMTGNGSAIMIESVGTLINAVTQAATSITGISYNNDIVEIRREELRLREKKMTIESIAKGAKEVHITNNNLTMTREELLKELQDSAK